MLLVNARVDRSFIHGLGLFALVYIPKGSEVWRFTPGFDLDLDPSSLEVQQASFRMRLLHYGYIGRYTFSAAMMRASPIPNLWPDFTIDLYGVDIASFDIASGERDHPRLREGDPDGARCLTLLEGGTEQWQ